MYLRLMIAMVALALSLPLPAQEGAGPQAFDKIRTLAGDWEGTYEWTGARTDKGTMNAGYYVTGHNSAVVENLIQDGKPTMTTVYHMDGPTLRMTHYCAAQNQPRLKAEHIDLDKSTVDFTFVDVTNLKGPDAPHVHGLAWHMIDADHITLTFLVKAGSKESHEFIQLTRVSKKA